MEDIGVLERFCGSPLWYNQSVYDAKLLPNFTPCFYHTVLTVIPTIFFYLLAPVLYLQVRLYRQQQRFRQLPWTKLLTLKVISTAAALSTSLLVAVTNLFDSHYGQVDVWYPLIRIIFMIGFLVAQIGCQKTGIVSSGVLFNSALIQFLCNLPEFYDWLQSTFGYSESTEDGWHNILFLIWFATISGQLILQLFADQRYDKLERNSSTELDSSFLNRITMQWFTSLPVQGSRQTITEKDLFDLNTENTSEYLAEVWEYFWRPKIEEYNRKKKELVDESSDTMLSKNDLMEKENGLSSKIPKKRNHNKRSSVKMPSVFFTMFQIFKWQFFSSAGIRVLVDLLGFANPLLLHYLLGFVNSGSERIWEGAGYALLMFIASELKSLGHNYVQFIMFRTSTKLQSILIGATYKKTLCLSNSARRDRTVGQIVNVMAIDVERVQMITHHLHTYWSTPFQITLALIFLFQTLGIAALPGLFVMLSFVPVSMFASHWQRRYQQLQMQLKDERTKMINEVLNGIKIVKFNAWEPAMQKIIEGIREQELHCIRAHSLIRSALDCYNFSTPFLVALFSFATYIYIDSNNALTPQIAFVSLALFNQLRMPLMTIGVLINLSVQVLVSNKRIKELLTAEEIDQDSIDRQPSKDGKLAICVQNADFTWESGKSTPILRNISFEVETGKLIAVAGRVGSGKSSLLSAVLGEMEKLRGYVGVRGQIAYTCQEVFIQNVTFRENILFGQPFNEQLYNRIIKACALEADLAILPQKDATEIGEKGINLSGGQKARISLARAIYQNADIYLFDDPLAAVDSHVGKHIFEHLIGPNGLLRNKTRILVTHGVTFLREVNQILYIEDGQIVGNGGFDELMLKYSKFSALVAEASKQETGEEELDDKEKDSELVEDFAVGENEVIEELSDFVFQRQASTISNIMRKPQKQIVDPDTSDFQSSTNRLIRAEQNQTGNVKKDVYLSYIQAASVLFSSSFVLFYIGYAALQLLRNFWLTAWSDDSQHNKTEQMAQTSRMAVYAGIGFFESVCFAIARVALTLGGLKASRSLHNPTLKHVLLSPMSWFDSTPIGRILNRFGREIEVIDMQLPINFRFLLQCTTNVAATILAIVISTPTFLIICVILIGLYMYLLKFYVPTWRQLRRLETSARSPIYSHFAETIQGASSIRAFNKQQEFCDVNNRKLDNFVRIKYMGIVSRPWFGVRLELLGNFVTFFAALFAALSDKMGMDLSAGMVGLSVTYALQITDMLRLAVQQISELEVNLVSVERLKEYTELKSEADWILPESRPPNNWPTNGAVSIQNYSTRYRPGLELVVRNISANLKPGQKVGVVGRTGAGKSSLTLGLFRMIEPAEGRILIDGVDISKIGLHDLRSNITIIPQEPILFSGTLRFNLDPFENYKDAELWNALEMAHLSDFVSELPAGLQHQIAEGGANISMGQRQLICLARALLRRSKVLVLDEATASVDHQTDALIQQTIRREFAHSSVLCIAHRINTILDYDAVLVMDNGQIREFDSPQALLADPTSLFYSMAVNARIIAKN